MCYPHVGLDMFECYQRKWWFYMRYTMFVPFKLALYHPGAWGNSLGLGDSKTCFYTWDLTLENRQIKKASHAVVVRWIWG